MNMPAKMEFLESANASQQMTLRLQTALAATLVVLGITVVILSFVSPGLILVETLRAGQILGGTVVAASGFIAIFFSRRDKVVALRSLLHSYQHQQVGGLSPDARLDQYFDQYFAMETRMNVSTPLTPGDELPGMLEHIERREKSARTRGILYSLLPVALTVVLLGYTASSVRNAHKQVDALKTEAATYTTQIDTLKQNTENYKTQSQSLQGNAENYKNQVTELQAQLAETQKTLSEAVTLSRAVRPIDSANAKELASRFPGSESLLLDLLDLRQRRIKWKVGGQSLQEGLDSPGFAMYFLRQKRASGIELRPGESLSEASRSLYDKLPPTTQPRNGDLVFYRAGYAMFYFADPREGPFVLGMTPFGITALKSDFAKPVGYRQVQWR